MLGSIDGQRPSQGSPTEEQVLAELQMLTHSPGFIYTLALSALKSTFVTQEDAANPHSRLSVKELTLAAGLMVTAELNTADIPSEEGMIAQTTELNALLGQLHQIVIQPMEQGSAERRKASLETNAGQSHGVHIARPHAREFVEPFFYVGTGAYDFQYLALAREKYAHDADWLTANVGLSADLLIRVASGLQGIKESRYLDALLASTHEESCRTELAMFLFGRDDLEFLTDSEFNAFVDRFALTPGDVRHKIESVGAENEMEYRPIIRLEDGALFMPVGFKLAQAIYDSPFYWMLEDKGYDDRAMNNRGRVTEEIAARLLEPLFGEGLYRNVVVKEGKQEVNEIDLLAVVGTRALVIQAKSKRLTALSRQGDDNRLEVDFQQAVQDAYDQGLASRRALLNTQGQRLAIDGVPNDVLQSIDQVYVICLTLDHFPALPYVTDRFLLKEPENPGPVAMSVFDLDILATYLIDPFEFLHYIDQRVRWSGVVHGSCESAFLATYLDRGLALPNDHDLMVIGESMVSQIDRDFPTICGRNDHIAQLLGNSPSDSDSIVLKSWWRESELRQAIDVLKRSAEPKATDALFMLYDLPRDAAEYAYQRIEEAIRNCSATGEASTCSIQLEGESGISYICLPNPHPNIKDILNNHAGASKYKQKASKWLGLIGVPTEPIAGVSFDQEPWAANPELDDLARSVFQPDIIKKPGRNQTCWCGSGLKYKKCHER